MSDLLTQAGAEKLRETNPERYALELASAFNSLLDTGHSAENKIKDEIDLLAGISKMDTQEVINIAFQHRNKMLMQINHLNLLLPIE